MASYQIAGVPTLVAAEGRTLTSCLIPGIDADRVIQELLDNSAIDFVALRHGEAGCFIGRVDRG
jgi:hypothetical protein